MNNLAPRQGIFAIILLVSFCSHVLMLMFSTEKQQFDHRTTKGEAIVAQLSKEAMVALANQDRISLSVLANRYQVDDEVAKLVITDQNNQNLVQTGQAQTAVGQVIDKPITQNNRTLGHVIVTMKAISKGEIVANQWLFILGSLILHGFLWVIYRYVARPTAEQLAEIGEKVQQRIALARGQQISEHTSVSDDRQTQGDMDSSSDDEAVTPQPATAAATAHDKAMPNLGKSIRDFLDAERGRPAASEPAAYRQADTSPTDSSSDSNAFGSVSDGDTNPVPNHPSESKDVSLELQIRFFDEFGLLGRVAPELGKPYLLLCEQLLARAQASLFDNAYSNKLYRYVRDVKVTEVSHFTQHGTVVYLRGNAEQVALASVLLAKLVIILNQVVYEKHRELSRFALPLTVGTGIDQQFEEVRRLMNNHGSEDGILMLLPQPLLKTLQGQVKCKPLLHPTSLSEREAVRYDGLAERYMTELIKKRDAILTSPEPANTQLA